MTPMRRTLIFLGSIVIALLAWEFYAIFQPSSAALITAAVQKLTFNWPMLPLLTGILLGHLFWPNMKCVNCKFRPWAKDDNFQFDRSLEAYFAHRMSGEMPYKARTAVFGAD